MSAMTSKTMLRPARRALLFRLTRVASVAVLTVGAAAASIAAPGASQSKPEMRVSVSAFNIDYVSPSLRGRAKNWGSEYAQGLVAQLSSRLKGTEIKFERRRKETTFRVEGELTVMGSSEAEGPFIAQAKLFNAKNELIGKFVGAVRTYRDLMSNVESTKSLDPNGLQGAMAGKIADYLRSLPSADTPAPADTVMAITITKKLLIEKGPLELRETAPGKYRATSVSGGFLTVFSGKGWTPLRPIGVFRANETLSLPTEADRVYYVAHTDFEPDLAQRIVISGNTALPGVTYAVLHESPMERAPQVFACILPPATESNLSVFESIFRRAKAVALLGEKY
ncbi:MAG: hypothetical protein SFX74_13600 [Fimbriimonadaceae bacterium]|nr:hypothetical protein [Fimbriimonadaceae bacterium]